MAKIDQCGVKTRILPLKKNGGPDFKVRLNDETIVWIEVVCPQMDSTELKTQDYKSVRYDHDNPDSSWHETNHLNDNVKSRWTQKINDKLENFEKYQSNNIIKDKDYCVIAICTEQLLKPYPFNTARKLYSSNQNPFLKVELDALAITYGLTIQKFICGNKPADGERIKLTSHILPTHSPEFYKNGNVRIEQSLFTDAKFKIISALWEFSNSHPANLIVHNCFAKNRLASKKLPADFEVTAKADSDGDGIAKDSLGLQFFDHRKADS